MRSLAIVLLAGCMESRAEELVCAITDDCDPGRVCDRGYCVLAEAAEDPVAPPPLAPPANIDCESWSARHFDPCALPGGTAVVLTDGSYIYDTAQARLFDPAGTEVATQFVTTLAGRVLVVDSLTIGPNATLRAIGNVPLVIASWSTIEIAGAIDVGSTADSFGAGAGPGDCAARAATKGENDQNGAAGGGGGGFGGAGGKGGKGDTAIGGIGGLAIAATPLLLGGCSGARGGRGGPDGGLGGLGGAGGGAIQLSARLSISVSGGITAGGAGGGGAQGGGDADGGGGGGGSGGMIGFETPDLAIAVGATVAANGGGGGQGADTMLGGRGTDGLLSGQPAAGGVGGDGDRGGIGSALMLLAGTRGEQDGGEGAGGGGGGAGIIVIASTSKVIDGTVSPPAR